MGSRGWVVGVLIASGTACTADRHELPTGTDASLVPSSAAQRPPTSVRIVDGLENLTGGLYAIGSVWAVTSNRPDEFSQGELQASVVRIDPASGSVEHVLGTDDIEPELVEAGGRVWVKTADRVIALDAHGSVVAEIPLALGRAGGMTAAGGRLWAVVNAANHVVTIDPSDATIVQTLDTGRFPVRPIAAFGSVWVPNLIDGTVTIIETEPGSETSMVTTFVADGIRFLGPVPGGPDGDAVWVTNIDGDVFAVSAERDRLGQVRRLRFDRPINTVVAHGDVVILLPTWGKSVLAVDIATLRLLEEIGIDSIPVRGLSAAGAIWVVGDGTQENATVIDPGSLTIRGQFPVGANESNTTGPQQPVQVDDQVWVPNRGANAFFIVDAAADS